MIAGILIGFVVGALATMGLLWWVLSSYSDDLDHQGRWQ